MKFVRRTAYFVLGLGIAFCLMYFFHRVGDGDHYAQSFDRGDSGIYGPVVSPRTGLILFASFKTGRGDLYTVDQNGQHLRRLTDDPNCENSPTFSPNGRQIAYIKETLQAGSLNVYKGQAWIMNADGSHARPVTHDETNYEWPQFSADGTALYLWRETPDFAVSRTELFKVPVTGNHAPVLVPGNKGREPADIPVRDYWNQNASPYKSSTLYTSTTPVPTLWIGDNEESGPGQKIFQCRNEMSHPCFSRDGRFLFFHEENRFGPIALSRISVKGTGYRRLVQTRR